MEANTGNTLPKKERLCGKTSISKLLAKGKHGNVPNMRYLCLKGTGNEENRIMVSVPKKLFKRAVKRNLLKRRIRESYRKQKHNLTVEGGLDVLFMYSTALRENFLSALPESVQVNSPTDRSNHIISITLPSIKSQSALNALSAKGIYVSSGSACSSHGGHGSYVLLAFGLTPKEADCTLRISLSRYTTDEELLTAANGVREVCDTLVTIQ